MRITRTVLKVLWNATLLSLLITMALLMLYSVQPMTPSPVITWDDIFEFEPPSKHGSNYCRRDMNRTHQKVLAFSVYGAFAKRHPDYLDKVASSVEQVDLYKGWRVRFYHDHALSQKTLDHIREKYDFVDLCDVREIPQLGNLTTMHNMMWRFITIGDPSVDVFVSRDIETPVTHREAAAVIDWLSSDKLLHTMRDHPMHDSPIAGGMWGFQNHVNRPLGIRFMNMFLHAGSEITPFAWRYDQSVLQRWVWPRLRDSVVAHDSFYCGVFEDTTRPWPIKRNESGSFVGCESYKDLSCDVIKECPERCRPKEHKDWVYC